MGNFGIKKTMKKTQFQQKEHEIKRLNELIKKEYSKEEEKYVILDGIVDIEKYLSADFKILWVLKEPHDKGDAPEGWSMINLLNEAGDKTVLNPDMQPTFRRIIYSTYGILKGFLSLSEMDKIQENHNMIDILQSIALINIRKLPGPKKSDKKIIEETYQKYRTIILKQIKVIEPDIIIIGVNTIKDLINDLSKVNHKHVEIYPIDYYLSNKRIVIDAYHPLVTKGNPNYSGGSVSDEIYCNSIIEAVKNWYIKKTN